MCSFSDYEVANSLGTVALALILAEGGITTNWAHVRPQLGTGVLLSTLGVAVSVAVVAGGAVWLFGLSWKVAIILGAVVSSTDAAAVFSVLRRLGLPSRILSTLELESGLNDAPVVLIVVALSIPDDVAVAPWWQIAVQIAAELVGGAVIGILVAWLGVQLLRRVALPSSGLYSVTVLAILVLAYAPAAEAHTSGFLAVYAAGVVLGNAKLPHKRAAIAFAEAIAWIAQMGVFIMLGLLVSPPKLVPVIVPALVIGAILLFIARPLSVLVSVAWLRCRCAIRSSTPGRDCAGRSRSSWPPSRS